MKIHVAIYIILHLISSVYASNLEFGTDKISAINQKITTAKQDINTNSKKQKTAENNLKYTENKIDELSSRLQTIDLDINNQQQKINQMQDVQIELNSKLTNNKKLLLKSIKHIYISIKTPKSKWQSRQEGLDKDYIFTHNYPLLIQEMEKQEQD